MRLFPKSIGTLFIHTKVMAFTKKWRLSLQNSKKIETSSRRNFNCGQGYGAFRLFSALLNDGGSTFLTYQCLDFSNL
jgi:hypothetical protein